ncbi:hypothetical protein G6514_001478 [Epicoccum nigrum]|nr:hypothetical protein G6514_001478 [Epicoccum nigrum]
MGRGRAKHEDSWRADPEHANALFSDPLEPFRAQLDPAGKNRKEAEETALIAEIEVNDAKREVAEKKYIEDQDEALRSAAEAAEDA